MNASRPRRRRGGFTLMEVLLVLVILVALASMAVLAYGPIQESANKQTARVQIGVFEKAIARWKLNIGTYPTSLDILVSPQAPSDLPNPAKWSGPYVDGNQVPLDPWDQPYQYACPGQQNPAGFDVWSAGNPSNPEPIGNWE